LSFLFLSVLAAEWPSGVYCFDKDPKRLVDGKLYDFTFASSNLVQFINAQRAVGTYREGSPQKKQAAQVMSQLDPSKQPWGKYILSGMVTEKKEKGAVLALGTISSPISRTGKSVFIENGPPFPQLITIFAVPIGKKNIGGVTFDVYDYGSPVTNTPAVDVPK
jgi:hypothetical protein